MHHNVDRGTVAGRYSSIADCKFVGAIHAVVHQVRILFTLKTNIELLVYKIIRESNTPLIF